MPIPAPTATSAAMNPTAPATLARGELVPDDAEGQRQHATADALHHPGEDHQADEVASAASSEPTASAAIVMTRISVLPTMSPRRPMIGVKIDAESR